MRVLLDVLSVCLLILGGLVGRRVYQQLRPWPTGSKPTHYGQYPAPLVDDLRRIRQRLWKQGHVCNMEPCAECEARRQEITDIAISMLKRSQETGRGR